MTSITNAEDVIDSRDVIERIEELQAQCEDFASREAWAEECPDEAEELEVLAAFASDAADYAPDWNYGTTLIRESYFKDYCQELVEDIGDLPEGIPSYVVVDWEATARNLKVDYTEVSFGGVTYFVR